jgi:hypothetical protein
MQHAAPSCPPATLTSTRNPLPPRAQACTHCHVESSPRRTEMMDAATVDRCLELLASAPGVHTLDITGGAPELIPQFRCASHSSARAPSPLDPALCSALAAVLRSPPLPTSPPGPAAGRPSTPRLSANLRAHSAPRTAGASSPARAHCGPTPPRSPSSTAATSRCCWSPARRTPPPSSPPTASASSPACPATPSPTWTPNAARACLSGASAG